MDLGEQIEVIEIEEAPMVPNQVPEDFPQREDVRPEPETVPV